MAVGAHDREVHLGVKDDLAGLASELGQGGQMMRLDVPLTVRAIALAEVKAARPTRDYDGRYGTATGPWTTDMFVEAVYRDVRGR